MPPSQLSSIEVEFSCGDTDIFVEIKPKDKTSEKFAVHSKNGDVKKISQKSKCLEVDKNRNLKR